MDNVYLVLVVVLFALAISDLIVGVSNDAVNFLNSAIGSKAAPFKIIMGIAALGILVGTTFSSGMMEVARKGIFHPEHFYFAEIMVIFLAVMITDIILLDTFNTFGMPTSTTVSIVFELLGAAVSVAIVKISSQPEAITNIAESLGIDAANVTVSTFINTDKAILIVSGILLSVIVAFSVGAFVQWISRMLFSFSYAKSFKYYGSIWGGLAIMAITYFILIKGIKGSTYSAYEMYSVFQGNASGALAWINEHFHKNYTSIDEMIKGVKGQYIWIEDKGILNISLTGWVKEYSVQIMIYSFIAWAIILQILQFLKVNILKIVVYVGTFAIAMAFAGNDLVNFIGVPLAGFHSYQDWVKSGADASTHLMSGLTGKVETAPYLLIVAGLIMVITLWVSKKARSVIKTSLDLSRQDEGEEKFGSSIMARNIVRAARKSAKATKKILPNSVNNFFEKQFDTNPFKQVQAREENPPAFDMIRASVNLVVASILISIGTSFKLPLSTTYVTFMVAMGTSLADKAWSKESAVFRITGVISVIGGWFFTAFSAFSVAFIVALLFTFAGFYAIFGLLAIVLFLVIRSHIYHKKKIEEHETKTKLEDDIKESNIVEKCTVNITDTLNNVSSIIDKIFLGLNKEDRKILKEANKDVNALNKQAKYLKDNVYKTIIKLDKDSIKTGHFYVQVLDYLRETAHALTFISQPSLDHVDNNFGELLDIQIKELSLVSEKIKTFYKEIIKIINTKEYDKLPDMINLQQQFIDDVNTYRITQIKRVKHKEAGTKNSVLYLGILHEVKNLFLNGINLLKAQRDFDDFKKI